MRPVPSETRRRDAPVVGMQTRNLVTRDGCTLVARRLAAQGPERGVVFVGHGQAHHSLTLTTHLQGLAAQGWTVHACDLRGHGHSASGRAPLAHMEPNIGWERLVSDLRLALADAFAGVPWERRMVVVTNISAALAFEVLKSWPDLAARIVLAAPPMMNATFLGLGRTFMQARMRLRPADKPDDLAAHQMYTFLAAQVPGRRALIDVVSSDRALTEALEADPLGWPTPTSGYLHDMFRGLAQAWNTKGAQRAHPGTRVLIVHGDEDPVSARGRLVEPLAACLRQIGVTQVDRHVIPGGRGGLLLEETRFGLSALFTDWATGTTHGDAEPTRADAPASRVNPTEATGIEATGIEVTGGVLDQLGISPGGRPLGADELVELCYNAIDDESRWIELLYRLAHALHDDSMLPQDQLDAVVSALMPHWERSFTLHRQIAQAAAVGTVLQNVVERFRIGVAIVDADLGVLFANAVFAEQIGHRLEGPGDGTADSPGDALSERDRAALGARLGALCDAATRERMRHGAGEALLVREDEIVGFHFRPAALRQTMLNRGGASGVVILRADGAPGADTPDTLGDLLQLAYGLTRKEAETALALLDGLSAEAIGDKLDVSVNTVRTHLKRVYDKIGVQTQTELVARLLRGPVGLLVAKGGDGACNPGHNPGHTPGHTPGAARSG